MGLQAWHWLVIGLFLTTLELFLPSFMIIWFGVAAILTAVLTWLVPMGLMMQVLLWLVLSVLLCVLWFKLVQPRIKNRTKAGLGGAVIIGEIGMIIDASSEVATVRFAVPKVGASEWQCRTADGRPLMVGDRVVVTQILGNELIVQKR